MSHIDKILEEGVSAKFEQNEDLAKLLMNTGSNIIVEANKYDTLCSVGEGLFDPDIWDISLWQGQNRMGKVLMIVRDKLFKMQEQSVYVTS